MAATAAVETKCDTLWSEDLQNGRVVRGVTIKLWHKCGVEGQTAVVIIGALMVVIEGEQSSFTSIPVGYRSRQIGHVVDAGRGFCRDRW